MFKFCKVPFSIFLVLSLLYSCSKKEKNIVVTVEDQQLSKEEIINRYKTTKEYRDHSSFTKDKIKKFIDESVVGDLLISVDAIRTGFDKKPEVIEKVKEERKRLLIRANGPLYNVIIKDHLTISEAELKEFYDQIKDQIRIAQIVVSSKMLADSLYQVLQNGADFSQMAALFSIDISSKDRGGSVNQLFTQGSFNSNFEKVAFSLRLHEISTPIKTTYGYQIIKLINKQNAKKQPFEKMRSTLERKLKSKKINDFTEIYYDQLFKTYELSIEPENAKKIIAAYASSNTKTRKPQISFENISEEENELPVILFKGGQWNIEYFIDKYNNSTYINHIPLRRVEDVLNFGHREGIKEMMYLEAVNLKLDENENFKKEFETSKNFVAIREYKQGMTRDLAEPNEEELKVFYEQNKQKYQGRSFELVRNQVVYELKNFKSNEKINSIISDLRQKYKIEFIENMITTIVDELNDSKKQS